MFTDPKLSQIIVRSETTGEVLAVINRDGSVLNPCEVSIGFNYGKPKTFILVEGE